MADGFLFGVGFFLGILVAVVAIAAYEISQRLLGQTDVAPPPADDTDVLTLLAALPQSHIVVDADDAALRASSITYAYGLVRQGVLREELADLAARARSAGAVSDLDLRLPRREEGAAELRLWVRATPIAGDKVLILFEDNTEKRRLEETRRDFVANVSHELKTPVGAIGLLAETLTQVADEPDNVRRFSARLNAEAERLSQLVQEIIQLSRLQDANVLADSEFVDVDDVVREALDRVRVEADSRGVRLVWDGTAGLRLYGDRALLTTAVRNLLDNAVRYSRHYGQVSVAVSAEAGEVHISVIDQGEGIAQEAHERIFERFYRGDRARSRETGGTGLGLSIVKHVATDHGGRVQVWSRPGQGSTFTMILPEAYVPSHGSEGLGAAGVEEFPDMVKEAR
ncbi:sensor histidine kinase [Trueperella pyogenes]|uniref:sensor histidine kinase n=1 Tax=Trueperella pyogenes TaxID=1661 RepID=UPI000D52BD17|nr:ATP-binding protein [Trueperella pyogenes]AWG03850.1 two-component sensor histidine kinase [Trueperella pyogenes]AWG16580.1 two-component sensor histidine kinase [Trueperella pyogenes]AZR05459.1 two-component sensor histidine kinase [Trueperella pyogenes]QIU87128.1 two-component sensor histidine kinase [Trueperella pyogenes]